jgi:sterol desaturase/sphingolipid hydroxylase (fatty acid hydroxylase superfamily)
MNELSAGFTQARPFIPLCVLVALLAWESFSPFFDFLRGRKRLLHGGLNVLMGVVNALMTGAVFVGLWWMTARWAEAHQFGLLYQLAMPAPIRLVVACLLFDAWMYTWHRLNHRIPFLWRFHRVHHSDPQMDVTTANRFHFGEIIISSFLRIPVIALLGMQMHEIAIYEVLMFTVVQFHHANIALPEKLDRVARLFIVTPFMHKVHHSRWQPETDSNYASLLSVWDRLFGSFRLNREPASLRFGLDEFEAPSHQSLRGMLGTPWSRIGSDGKAVKGGVTRALLIVLPAAALLAGAWFLGQSMKPATERIKEMKQVMDLDGSFTAWSEEERKIVPSTAR